MSKGLSETAKYWVVSGFLSLVILALVATVGNKKQIENELVNRTENTLMVVSER